MLRYRGQGATDNTLDFPLLQEDVTTLRSHTQSSANLVRYSIVVLVRQDPPRIAWNFWVSQSPEALLNACLPSTLQQPDRVSLTTAPRGRMAPGGLGLSPGSDSCPPRQLASFSKGYFVVVLISSRH